jgi:hypothetical protein
MGRKIVALVSAGGVVSTRGRPLLMVALFQPQVFAGLSLETLYKQSLLGRFRPLLSAENLTGYEMRPLTAGERATGFGMTIGKRGCAC